MLICHVSCCHANLEYSAPSRRLSVAVCHCHQSIFNYNIQATAGQWLCRVTVLTHTHKAHPHKKHMMEIKMGWTHMLMERISKLCMWNNLLDFRVAMGKVTQKLDTDARVWIVKNTTDKDQAGSWHVYVHKCTYEKAHWYAYVSIIVWRTRFRSLSVQFCCRGNWI